MHDDEPADTPLALDLAGRHRMWVDPVPDGHVVRFVTPEGAVPIAVVVTAAGITLKLDSPTVTLEASGTLNLSADRLLLGGRQGVEIASGGAMTLAAAGELSSVARAHAIRAEQGSVAVKASDDVKLSGERVMVNCDETIDRYYRQPTVPTALPSAPEPEPASTVD